jgi:phosphocarrier protein NPr/phosphocarrier protein
MLETELEIGNRLGLHARAAAKMVAVASRYDARIRVRSGDRQPVDAKSIMGLLTLGAAQGTKLYISVDGDDEEQALAALTDLFERHFDEET